jgi:predicted Zn-dependent protease
MFESELLIKSFLSRVIELASPFGVEIETILSGGTRTVARYANNNFHQNVSENRFQLYIRVIDGDKKTGVVQIGEFSEASIKAAIQKACTIAQNSESIPHLLPLLPHQEYQTSVGRYDPALASLSLERFTEHFSRFFDHCESAKFITAGALTIVNGTLGDYGDLSPLAMANSNGLFAYAPSTWVDFSTTVYSDMSSGWSGNAAHSLSEIDIPKMCEIALQKAMANKNTSSLEPGTYTVILEPAAARELISYLAGSFNAQAVSEGRSFVTGKLGKKTFPSWFSLEDDAFHSRLGGAPFDGEGVPTRKVGLVRDGVIESVVNSRWLAKTMRVAPTGHGLPLPNPVGALPTNIRMSDGKESLETLISGTKRGVLITRCWYTTSVDEKKLIVSGMTRDGTFLIENGKISTALKNLRFNQSIPAMLESVSGSTKSEMCFGSLIPALRVDKFQFTSATEF